MSPCKQLCYTLERNLGHKLFRQPPPKCFRTLKLGVWIRDNVPGLRKCIAFYEGRNGREFFDKFPQKVLAIPFMTKMHCHRSIWDGDLTVAVLNDIGFINARDISHGEGTDARLIKDQDDEEEENLYVEALKPGMYGD